jgi:hypothetical protein
MGLYILTNLHWSINELLSFMMLKMFLNYIQCLIKKIYEIKTIKRILYFEKCKKYIILHIN